jgi:serine/threonine protein phosphatase PrpC
MLINYAASTHVGAVRTENQDALVLDGWLSQTNGLRRGGTHRLIQGETWAAAVVDGMGGYAGGGTAALVTAARLAELLRRCTPDDDPAAFASLYTEASNAVSRIAEGSAELDRMGATAASILVGQDCLVVTNVGDARVYRWWRGFLSQISEDDRLNQESNVITQALGRHLRGDADPHYLRLPVTEPATFLLCSDGLSDCVNEEEIRAILESNPDLMTATRELESAALAAGAPDNTTIVLVALTPPEEDEG